MNYIGKKSSLLSGLSILNPFILPSLQLKISVLPNAKAFRLFTANYLTTGKFYDYERHALERTNSETLNENAIKKIMKLYKYYC